MRWLVRWLLFLWWLPARWLRDWQFARAGASSALVPLHRLAIEPDYPRDLEAPRVIVAQLQLVDRSADLLYLGWGRWLLVAMKPDARHTATGARIRRNAHRLLELWATNPKFKANPGAFRRLYGRYLYGVCTAAGARPISDYPASFVRRYGLEAIVTDFRRMDWMFRTVTDTELFDDNHPMGLGYAKEQARLEADADLRSEYRHMHAWRYLSRLTHGVTRYDNPETPRHRSGFTTVATISAPTVHPNHRTRSA